MGKNKPSLPTLPTFPTYLTYLTYLTYHTYLTYLTYLQICLKHRTQYYAHYSALSMAPSRRIPRKCAGSCSISHTRYMICLPVAMLKLPVRGNVVFSEVSTTKFFVGPLSVGRLSISLLMPRSAKFQSTNLPDVPVH